MQALFCIDFFPLIAFCGSTYGMVLPMAKIALIGNLISGKANLGTVVENNVKNNIKNDDWGLERVLAN